MQKEHDTETLLALLASLLDENVAVHTTQDTLLSVLVDAEGDVELAAARLHASNMTSKTSNERLSGKKRKRPGLDRWIVNKKAPGVGGKSRDQTERGDPSTSRPSVENVIEVPDDDGDNLPTGSNLASSSKPKPTLQFSRPPVSLMSVLKQAPIEEKKRPIQLAPLTLGTPALVAEYTHCTLHYSILPPELACRLFYVMLKEAAGWDRNRWWLFDRVVESPHKTAFYARETDGYGDDRNWQEAAQYWYNGKPTAPPKKFLPEMEDACRIVEQIVNGEISKRTRFSLEWPADEANPWQANVAASNCYTGSKEGVGFHSDQLTYLGPYPTIASLSLGTTRTFRLREVVPDVEKDERKAQTFNMHLPHNSLVIMHAGCQERFKHTIPPQSAIDAFKPPFPPPDEFTEEAPSPYTSRINITFRFYRPDFRPDSIPRCHCGVPTVLRPAMKKRGPPSFVEKRVQRSGQSDSETINYNWTCYAGAQNEGQSCNFYQVLDMETEGRGAKQDEYQARDSEAPTIAE